MRTDADLTGAITTHSDTVWRVCTLYFAQKYDKEDAFQSTFLKYATSDQKFKDEDHRKAWLIRVAANTCKDMLKSTKRSAVLFDNFKEDAHPLGTSEAHDDREQHNEILEALQTLPTDYREVLYLTYFEGYSAVEIGKILDKPPNTIYTHIARGKNMLKEVLNRE